MIHTEALTKVHIVCYQGSSPNCLILMRHHMGDRGKANLRDVGSEEDVFVDKKRQLLILHLNGA